MANKQSFTPEEWTKILESTMLAGMAVSAADPSGVWGLVKESFAGGSALAAAKSDAGSSELVKAIIADYETSEGRSTIQEALRKRFAGAKPADAVQRSLANLREVSAILDAKAPNDAPVLKAWLSGSARKSRPLQRKAVFSVLAAFRLAKPRRLLWVTSQRHSAPAPEQQQIGSGATRAPLLTKLNLKRFPRLRCVPRPGCVRA